MTLRQSILATLAYHDIFDYPLALEEIQKFLIEKKAEKQAIEKELKLLHAFMLSFPRKRESTLFALKNRKKIFSLRKQRTKYSKSKLKRAKLFSHLLFLIPTVKMVAISGALAMQNSHKNDDIDFVIVTSKGSLWTTRFFANLILFPFKRKPIPKKLPTTYYQLPTNNRACLNLFLDESDLKIRDQNLYTAHELCQLRVILNRDQTYSRLIKANQWVRKYLPNWQPIELSNSEKRIAKKKGASKKLPTTNLSRVARRAKWDYPLPTVETICKKFQLWYMRKRVSTERLGDTQLFFHPKDTQNWVLHKYRKKTHQL